MANGTGPYGAHPVDLDSEGFNLFFRGSKSTSISESTETVGKGPGLSLSTSAPYYGTGYAIVSSPLARLRNKIDCFGLV
jgi:hypothetical protein